MARSKTQLRGSPPGHLLKEHPCISLSEFRALAQLYYEQTKLPWLSIRYFRPFAYWYLRNGVNVSETYFKYVTLIVSAFGTGGGYLRLCCDNGNFTRETPGEAEMNHALFQSLRGTGDLLTFILWKAHCMTTGKWEEKGENSSSMLISYSPSFPSQLLVPSPFPVFALHGWPGELTQSALFHMGNPIPAGCFSFPVMCLLAIRGGWKLSLRDTHIDNVPPGDNGAPLDTDYRIRFQRINCLDHPCSMSYSPLSKGQHQMFPELSKL